MTTTEQKIEKLLEDLNSYVREYDYENEYGLPCHDTSDMVKMKAIVQAFVDSLEEDKPTDFDENQLNAYRAFLEAGIPDEWANAMADRVNMDRDLCGKGAWECVECFAVWEMTMEGFHFWDDVATEVAREGISAFSKFQCPK